MKKKIRFFNTFEPVITIYRDLAPALSSAEFEVELVISSAAYRADKVSLETLSEQHRGIVVRRLWAPVRSATNRLSKLGIMASYLAQMSLRSLLGNGSDMNVFLTQPPLSSCWGMALKTLRRQQYACLLMDIYPEVLIKSGVVSERGLVAKLMRRLVIASWMKADAIIVIGRCMRDHVVACGVAREKIHVIPNWNDERAVYPVDRDKNTLSKELGYSDRFIVLYSGNLGESHWFDDLLHAAEHFRDDDSLRFVIVGSGSRRREVEAGIKQRGLSNVDLLPYQPFNRLHESLSMADVHYISLRSGFEGIVVPSKTYPALGSGRPIIFSGESTGEVSRTLDDCNAGITIRIGDTIGLIEAIRRYKDDPGHRRHQGKNAIDAASNRCSRATAVGAYVGLFQSLLAPGAPSDEPASS